MKAEKPQDNLYEHQYTDDLSTLDSAISLASLLPARQLALALSGCLRIKASRTPVEDSSSTL